MKNDKYDIEVKLLAITGLSQQGEDIARGKTLPQSEIIIEHAGRLCWDTGDRLGTNEDRIQEWIRAGHESVIEHASATFFIKASRVLTHELVRHRIASFSQRSQRYVKETQVKYIAPPELADPDNPACNRIFIKAMQEAWGAYGELLKRGIKPELARYVLPNACETQIIMSMNFRELRHFIKLRTSQRALPEMKTVAGKIKDIMKEHAPKVFSDL